MFDAKGNGIERELENIRQVQPSSQTFISCTSGTNPAPKTGVEVPRAVQARSKTMLISDLIGSSPKFRAVVEEVET